MRGVDAAFDLNTGDDLLEAETIMQDVLQRRLRVCGPAHQDTRYSESQLSNVREELAEFEPVGDLADWASAEDPTSEETYYFNAKTGARSWTRPGPRVLRDKLAVANVAFRHVDPVQGPPPSPRDKT